jgi:hypothetical protein
VVDPTGPAVGPAPASRDASNFVRFSISAVHGPAVAISIGKTSKAQAPTSDVIIFMAPSPRKIGNPRWAQIWPFCL